MNCKEPWEGSPSRLPLRAHFSPGERRLGTRQVAGNADLPQESGIFDIFEGCLLVLRELLLVCFCFMVWVLCSFFSVLTHAKEPKPTRFESFGVGMHGVSNKEGS